jgi:hypothetical protein
LRPHPESKPPSYHGSRESRRYRQRQKLLGQALRRVGCLVDDRAVNAAKEPGGRQEDVISIVSSPVI